MFPAWSVITYLNIFSVLPLIFYIILKCHHNLGNRINLLPITVAPQSKAWTVFARSNTGIVGSNPTQGMDHCVSLFCVCVLLCVGSGLATGSSVVQGVLPTVYRLRNRKSDQGPKKDCRAIDREYQLIKVKKERLCTMLSRGMCHYAQISYMRGRPSCLNSY
jgi:hypothetical protein